MNREVVRERKLPAFSIGVGDLEALILRLQSLFKKQEKVRLSIDIKLHNETIEFENIQELKNYDFLPDRITKFHLSLSGDENRVSLYSDLMSSPLAEVRATASNEAWCAGAVETAFSFLSAYKLWYHWFVVAPLGWLLFILGYVPAVLTFPPVSKILTFSKIGIIGYFFTLFAIAIMFLFRKKLFPACVIKITENETYIRKYSAEISLAIASISVIISIIGLYLNK